MKTRKSLLICLFLASKCLVAQWNPSTQNNTLLVSNTVNPTNISVVKDNKNGGFLFWEDSFESESNILYMHYDNSAKPSFRADGKLISNSPSPKMKPTTALLGNNAVVAYQEKDPTGLSGIYLQKVSSTGSLLFGENGIKLSEIESNDKDQSLGIDKLNKIYVSYVSSNKNIHSIKLAIFKHDGKMIGAKGVVTIYKSPTLKSQTRVVPDNSGGAYVLWLESNSGIAKLYGQHIDSTGSISWGKISWKKEPFLISENDKNVMDFSAKMFSSTQIYIVWETKKGKLSISHQLFDVKSFNVFPKNKVEIYPIEGDKYNPQFIVADSSVILSWTQEAKAQKSGIDIFSQKYDAKGQPLWGMLPKPVINTKGDQFSQQIESDGAGGAFFVWLDKKAKQTQPIINAQRINDLGKVLWDSVGIPVANRANTHKSYLQMYKLSDGFLTIFKENRNGKNDIYGQKISEYGTNITEFSDISSFIKDGEVYLTWQTQDEVNGKGFFIERSFNGASWEKLKFVRAKSKASTNTYEFREKVENNGNYRYRVEYSDIMNSKKYSEITEVNKGEKTYSSFTLEQNEPNPASKSTVIKFFLPYRAKVSIDLYKEVELVKSITNDYFNQGENSVMVDVQNLEPGIYFYKMKSGDFSDVKKMVIVK